MFPEDHELVLVRDSLKSGSKEFYYTLKKNLKNSWKKSGMAIIPATYKVESCNLHHFVRMEVPQITLF
jgi:hypothetical protein